MNRFRAFHVLTLLVLVISMLLATPKPVSAGATITVNTTSDEYGTNAGACSLREAIYAANTDKAYNGCPAGSGTDTIILKRGIYILTRNNPGGVHEDQAKYGDLDIRASLVIRGAGMDPDRGSVVYANPENFSDRIFHIIPPSGTISVSMSNLRIQGGNTSETRGGGAILNNGSTLNLYRAYITSNHANVEGGGVTNYAGSTLIVRYSTFDNNTSNDGGGIYNTGTLTLENSLLVGNSGSTTGGGLDNGSGSTATVKNSTIAQNLTSGDAYGGAGISNSGTLYLINSTIAENNGTGLLIELHINTVISNTIFSQGGYPNCSRKSQSVTIVSNGYNIIYGSAAAPPEQYLCSFVSEGDTNQDPLLSPLAYNGGVTKTYGFSNTGSPAIDAIPSGNPNCPPIDQRMYGRWVDGNGIGAAGCDIGAYEEGGYMLQLYFPEILR